MVIRSGLPPALLAAALRFAGPKGQDVLLVANWLAGSFDNRAQVQGDRVAGGATKRDLVLMTARPVQDPVDFGDGLYLYVETRSEGETRPNRQRVYRLKKSGARVRLEVLRIDGQVLGLLATDPQMLTQLSSNDLVKQPGCDVVLEAGNEGYAGSTGPRSCKSDRPDSAYVTSTLRISKDVVVILERGYDEKGVQTFGPADGRGYEFRRVPE